MFDHRTWLYERSDMTSVNISDEAQPELKKKYSEVWDLREGERYLSEAVCLTMRDLRAEMLSLLGTCTQCVGAWESACDLLDPSRGYLRSMLSRHVVNVVHVRSGESL